MQKIVALAVAVVAAVVLLGTAEKQAARPAPVDSNAPPLEKSEKQATRPAPVHPDIHALEKAVVDATIAYVHDDCKAAREALDRVDSGCRRLGREDVPKAPDDVIDYDQAFHKTVDLAREFATADRIEKSFDQFVWAQRACRICHDLARKNGVMAGAKDAPKAAP